MKGQLLAVQHDDDVMEATRQALLVPPIGIVLKCHVPTERLPGCRREAAIRTLNILTETKIQTTRNV